MEQALRFRVALSTLVTKAPWSIELRHLVRYDNAELEVIAFSHHSDLSAEQRQKRRHQTRPILRCERLLEVLGRAGAGAASAQRTANADEDQRPSWGRWDSSPRSKQEIS